MLKIITGIIATRNGRNPLAAQSPQMKLDSESKVTKTTQTPIAMRGILTIQRGYPTE